MAYVVNDGSRIWYEVSGQGETVVLTGGFAILDAQFEFAMPFLEQCFQVVNWHYRGSGRSDKTAVGRMSIDDWASDLRAVLDEVGAEQVILWSASTGALVNTRFAALAPERVRALIMYPEVTFGPENRRRLRFYADVVRHFGWEGLSAIFALFLPEHVRATPKAAEFASWEANIMEKYFDLESFERAVDTVASADVLASIALLKDHPILLLAGDSGALGAGGESFKRRADAVKALAPKTQVKVIPRTGGTYSMLEEPDACVAVVTDFLEALH